MFIFLTLGSMFDRMDKNKLPDAIPDIPEDFFGKWVMVLKVLKYIKLNSIHTPSQQYSVFIANSTRGVLGY